jgi:hypothetical protein
MTDTHIEMTEDAFDQQYPLLPNYLNPNASWAFGDSGGGCLFETYGEEIRFVSEQVPRTIWTLIDGEDGDLYVVSGLHFVNRVGYLISKVPVPEGVFVEVRLSSESDEAETTNQ